MPCVECLFSRKRLLYALFLRREPLTLRALLQQISSLKAMPWTTLFRNNIRLLQQTHHTKLREMLDPASSFGPWVAIIKSYPNEWKALVSKLTFFESSRQLPASLGQVLAKLCLTVHARHFQQQMLYGSTFDANMVSGMS
ncbi:unnamed protein product [Polarella glacialis]|uniref:Uncharacterized protein n=1 Tax=Polarella glacialis TaxID=89957 RepID=A0A813LEP0_POLGL|nr:unnamed protein product [Polarella glacialis]